MKHKLQTVEQHQDEKRVLLVRRHGFIFFRRVAYLAFLMVLPILFLVVIIPTAWDAILERTAGGVLVFLVVSLYYLFVSLYFLHAWVDYYLDVWIVSTKRIVNIEQRGLFSRVVSELFLDKVQDVTVEVHGLLPTMMHFGDVIIQSAGENPRFFFDDVPKPYEIADIIMNLHKKYVEEMEQNAKSAAESPHTPPSPASGPQEQS
jgi:hypothetical protein